jgi:KDO2-lipid IV(A) lauroyltransferase
MSIDLKENILKDSYRNLAITLVEMLTLKYLSDEDMREYMQYDNIDLLTVPYAKGKGLIMLSGHLGNWEFLAYSAGLFTGISVAIIVQPQKNKYADKIMNEYRTKSGNSVVSMYTAARKIVSVLSSGGALALLADQSATEDKDIFVDFFGRPAATYEAPANLSLKYGSPIVMGFPFRQNDGTYKVILKEVKSDDLHYSKEDIIELTKRHVKILEDMIRDNPGLWAWQHRKWKHQPKTN